MRLTRRSEAAVILAMMLFCQVWGQEDTTAGPDASADHSLLPYGFTDRHYEKMKLSSTSLLDQTNPLKLFFVALIRGYQVFFSSQDGSTCQFRPSCSHFGASAVKTMCVATGHDLGAMQSKESICSAFIGAAIDVQIAIKQKDGFPVAEVRRLLVPAEVLKPGPPAVEAEAAPAVNRTRRGK